MNCVAATDNPQLACIGYGGSPCCQHHTGCDAVCIEYGEKPRIHLVEVKKGSLSLADAKNAIRQLNYCRENTKLAKSYELAYTIIADSYSQQALHMLKREARKLRRQGTKLERKKTRDKDTLVKLVLEVTR
jgi:hypothetical protein